LAVVLVDEGSISVGQVGDSIVVLSREDGTLEAVAPCPRGEYINEANFVTEPDWEDNLRTAQLDATLVTGIALSTDGLQFKILENITTGTPYAPFFEDAFPWAATPDTTSAVVLSFIDDLDDQSDDDKTLLLAVRAGSTRMADEAVLSPAALSDVPGPGPAGTQE
jgi:hypothetical protein